MGGVGVEEIGVWGKKPAGKFKRPLPLGLRETPFFIIAIALKSRSAPSAPIFLTLRLLKLQDLFEMKLLRFVFEFVNKLSPSCFHEFFDMLLQVFFLYRFIEIKIKLL